MDKNYQTNAAIVLSFLKDHGYSTHSVHVYESIFHFIGETLEQKKLTYTEEIGLSLIGSLPERFVRSNTAFIAAVRKLNSVYKNGEVLNVVISSRKGYSSLHLEPQYEDIVTAYIRSIETVYSKEQLENIRRRIVLFLKYLQSKNVHDTREISYELIFCYHDELSHLKAVSRVIEESSIHQFLRYLSLSGAAGPGLWICLYSIETGRAITMDMFSEAEQLQFFLHHGSIELTPDELLNSGNELISMCHKAGYCDGSIVYFQRTLDHFYLFLDMNGISYSKENAELWLKSRPVRKVVTGSSRRGACRFIFLLERFIRTGDPGFAEVHPRGISGLSDLPSWCSQPLISYMSLLKEEKLDQPTINNHVYSILRWYQFLLDRGHQSFENITPGDLTDFNLQDKHGSSEGKNACNTRIRRYIEFLHREGIIKNASLGLVLGYTAAYGQKLVTILNETEINCLQSYIRAAETATEIRDSAILLLGTEMGMRGCDIANLSLCDIDWHNQCIRFCQKKTDTDAWLAMPVSVGNAIYRYIKEVRPHQARSSRLFVSVAAPYKGITRQVCYEALHRALPERKAEGSGFHVTRKTFSTYRLRSGTPPEMISGVMGHRSTKSLDPYLYLDENRMKMCPLTMEELGISSGEVSCHE